MAIHNEALAKAIREAVERYERMSPVERAEMWEAQKRSFIIGEAGFGSDRDEPEYRAAVDRGDATEIARLDSEAEKRMADARAFDRVNITKTEDGYNG
jgi:hypothetical protein